MMNIYNRALLGVSCVVCAILFILVLASNAASATELSSSLSPADHFIQSCTKVDVTNDTGKLIGYTNCMGRIRGFVEGHEMTIKLVNVRSTDHPVDALWCVPIEISNASLIDTATRWVNTHPIEYYSLIAKYQESAGTAAVIIKALHERFPCEVKKHE